MLAGTTTEMRLPVEATPQAQREAPLSGAVIGHLDPRSGPNRRVQMSFRITAAAALATPVVSPPAPTGSQGVLPAGAGTTDGGMTSTQRTAVALIVVSALLVVLALTLATTSLRRRLIGPSPTPGPTPPTDRPGGAAGFVSHSGGDLDYGGQGLTPRTRTILDLVNSESPNQQAWLGLP
ncbi:hypothetical protein NKG94_30860 [Micromonospora sp. M12]